MGAFESSGGGKGVAECAEPVSPASCSERVDEDLGIKNTAKAAHVVPKASGGGFRGKTADEEFVTSGVPRGSRHL